jgi:hypothetical protein
MIQISDRNIPFRKPIGRDQLELLSVPNIDQDEATKRIIRRLITDAGEEIDNQGWMLPDDSMGAIDSAMSEFDPLINFSISIGCPYCENEAKYEVDLEEFALKKLQTIQRHLVHAIHTIAKNYHWSEQQILSIPSWRRAIYLSLIE